MKLGRLGVWQAMDVMTAAEGAAFAQKVEGWGYAALWLPESRGRKSWPIPPGCSPTPRR